MKDLRPGAVQASVMAAKWDGAGEMGEGVREAVSS